MAQFNVLELKNKAAFLADKENIEYIVIPKSGAVRPFRAGDEILDAMPACLKRDDKPILIYRNCQWCWQNGIIEK